MERLESRALLSGYQFLGTAVSPVTLPADFDFQHVESSAVGNGHGAPYVVGQSQSNANQSALFIGTETANGVTWGNPIWLPTVGANPVNPRSVAFDMVRDLNGSPVILGSSRLSTEMQATSWRLNSNDGSLLPTLHNNPNGATFGTDLSGGDSFGNYAANIGSSASSNTGNFLSDLPGGGGVALDRYSNTIVGTSYWTEDGNGTWTIHAPSLPSWSDGNNFSINEISSNVMGGYVYKPTADEILPAIWAHDGTLISTFDLAGYQVSEIIDDHGINVALLNDPTFSSASYIWAEGWQTPRLIYGDVMPALANGAVGVVKDIASGGSVWMMVEGHDGSGEVTSAFVTSVLTEPFGIPVPNFTGLPVKAGQGSTIHWDAIPGAASYRVQINNLTNHTVTLKEVVSTAELSATLRKPGQYAIWLQAISDTGYTSSWSAATNFEVQEGYQLIGTRTPLTELPAGFDFQHVESSAAGDGHGTPYIVGQSLSDANQSALFIGTETANGVTWSAPVWLPPVNISAVSPFVHADDLIRDVTGSPVILGSSTSSVSFQATSWRLNNPATSLTATLHIPPVDGAALGYLTGGDTLGNFAAQSGASASFNNGTLLQDLPGLGGVALDRNGNTIVGTSYWTEDGNGTWTIHAPSLPSWSDGNNFSINEISSNVMGGYVYNPTIDDILPALWAHDGTLISTLDLAGYQVSEIIDDHGTNVALLNDPDLTLPSYLWAEGWSSPRRVFGDLLPALSNNAVGVVTDLSSGGSLWMTVEVPKSGGGVDRFITSILTESFSAPIPNFTALPSTVNVASTVHWDAIPGASSYRVQINNLATGTVHSTSVIGTNELSVTITDTGRYAIWLQAISDTGYESDWSAGTTFTVAAQPLELTYQNGILSWTSTGAASYRVAIHNASNVQVLNETTSATSLPLTLAPGSYTAWVKPAGSVWSRGYRFTIYHAAIVVNPLTTVETTPLITWQGDTGGQYDVFVARKGETTSVQRHTVTGTSRVLWPLGRGEYTVWVRQLHTDGSFSQWGTGAALNIGTRPVLSLSGSLLSWSAVDSATHYEFWLSTSASTDRINVGANTVLSSSLDVSTLSLPSGSYRIWLRAIAGTGYVSLWSDAKPFTI